MKHTGEYIVALVSLFTLGLFGVASYYPLENLWGFNHLHFLPQWWFWVYCALILLAVYLSFGFKSEQRVARVVEAIDNLLFTGRARPRLILALVCGLLFYLFRVQTHLLGDGYTWLAEFGRGEAYIHKLTEPGSIYMLRWMQSLFGGFTESTALAAFQISSILSGMVIVFTLPEILRRLCDEALVRVLGLISVLFSGAMLLFFGYVEFYPVSWAASVLFIWAAVEYCLDRRRLWLVILLWLLAVAMHLQALYFIPGIAWLLVWAIKNRRVRQVGYGVLIVGAVASVGLMVWLYRTRIDFEILILPLFFGRPVAPDYAIVSWPHLLDLINEAFLILPGFVVIGLLWAMNRFRVIKDSVTALLAMLSAGSILFLLLFGAAITMGRDWDIFSLALLAPLLFVLRQIGHGASGLSVRVLTVYTTLVVLATVTFVAVNTRTAPTEERFYTLLNERNRAGWMIFANHYILKGDTVRYNQIKSDAYTRFPNYARLQKMYELLARKEYETAAAVAERLIQADPYNPDFLQIRGYLAGRAQRFDEAEEYYRKALRIKPYSSEMMNELGQFYIQQGRFDEAVGILKRAHGVKPHLTFVTESLALAYIRSGEYASAEALADTLFISDPNSPGAHLIKMTVALNYGDEPTARSHFAGFLMYGKGRSDYKGILEYYSYLAD